MDSYYIRKFGSLSESGWLDDTIPGKEISWINVNGLLIADRNLRTNISWNTLNQFGFVFGRSIEIDGHSYLCRLPKMGVDLDADSEWVNLIADTDTDNDLWHWQRAYSWGQETPIGKDFEHWRVCCGYSSSCTWTAELAEKETPDIGWRPILEPLIGAVDSTMIGRKLRVGNRSWIMSGYLVGYTDYDLLLDSPTPPNKKLLKAGGPAKGIGAFRYAIDRSRITYIKLEGS